MHVHFAGAQVRARARRLPDGQKFLRKNAMLACRTLSGLPQRPATGNLLPARFWPLLLLTQK